MASLYKYIFLWTQLNRNNKWSLSKINKYYIVIYFIRFYYIILFTYFITCMDILYVSAFYKYIYFL